jgi:hypothetical protein
MDIRKKHKDNLRKISKKYVREISKYIKSHKLYVYDCTYDFFDDALVNNFSRKLNPEYVSILLLDDPISLHVFNAEDVKKSREQVKQKNIDSYRDSIDYLKSRIKDYEEKINKLKKK